MFYLFQFLACGSIWSTKSNLSAVASLRHESTTCWLGNEATETRWWNSLEPASSSSASSQKSSMLSVEVACCIHPHFSSRNWYRTNIIVHSIPTLKTVMLPKFPEAENEMQTNVIEPGHYVPQCFLWTLHNHHLYFFQHFYAIDFGNNRVIFLLDGAGLNSKSAPFS